MSLLPLIVNSQPATNEVSKFQAKKKPRKIAALSF